MSEKVSYRIMESPIGKLLLVAQNGYLTKLWFLDDGRPYHPPLYHELDEKSEIMVLANQQLTEYFEGIRTTFELPLRFDGTTFNKTIWKELMQISYGETASYMDVAKRINKPDAVRAVGLANNRNPIAIICPCHRVIGSDGKLVGFGGGVKKKDWLLRHENRHSGKERQLELFETL